MWGWTPHHLCPLRCCLSIGRRWVNCIRCSQSRRGWTRPQQRRVGGGSEEEHGRGEEQENAMRSALLARPL